MSVRYDTYLAEHTSAVQKAGEWMLSYGIVPFDQYDLRRKFAEKLADHDASKRSEEEYEAYDDYFYGKSEDKETAKACFDYAWLHHIHQNPHHWQYWILREDEGKETALEMPEEEAYHMVADWWSFSWRAEDLTTIFDWYAKHKTVMVLHDRTRKLVESILERIKELIL